MVTQISWNRGFDTFYELHRQKHARNPFSPETNKCSGELLAKTRLILDQADLESTTKEDLEWIDLKDVEQAYVQDRLTICKVIENRK